MAHKEFKKLKISLEGQLMGLGWHRALKAMNIAHQYHNGSRKDGSPEFQHQVEQVLILLTLKDVLQPEECAVTTFLHDTVEDCNKSIDDIANGKEFNFGIETAMHVYNMSKVYLGIKRDHKEVMDAMALDPVASLCKLIDRCHNHGTMTSVFNVEKIKGYFKETKEDILPMGKKARKRFPEQAKAYYIMETILHRDIHMVESLLERIEIK